MTLWYYKFQFQNGSIKRRTSKAFSSRWIAFQFQNGSIKSIPAGSTPAITFQLFQFQNGSIKSCTLRCRGRITDQCFNSRMVRLKVFVESDECGDFSGFQFQNGSIKSSKSKRLPHRQLFQFQNGSIKSCGWQGSEGSLNVSIPEWFD